MSDSGKTSDNITQVPQQISSFMRLPRELRDKIYGFAAIKPDGHIGQIDEDGVACGLGAVHLHKDLPSDPSDHFHFPSGCRHPIHEKKQIFQDFCDYRCVNFALTCRVVYTELSTVFFKGNGFELRDAYDLKQFLLLVGPFRSSLIQRIRLFHHIKLKVEDFQDVFDPAWVDSLTFYHMLEQEYLDDDEPGSDLVRVLKYIKTCDNIKNFELVYRFEVPGEYFSVAKEGTTGYILNYAHCWFGESMKWEVHTENVLKKLRQDKGDDKGDDKEADKNADEEIYVELADFKANNLTKELATVQFDEGELDQYSFALMSACIAHAENCIEWAGDVENRVMDFFCPREEQ
jgi:hypothetical protein